MSFSWVFRKYGVSCQACAFASVPILVALSLALRFTLAADIQGPSFIFFVPAVLLASAFGGLWAGLFATVLSCLCSDYFLLPPVYSLKIESYLDGMGLMVFALTGGLIAVICELLRKTIRLGELANTDLVQAYKITDQLAAIVEGSSDAIVARNLDGVITSWNNASAAIFGYSAAEAIGSPIAMLVPPSLLAEEDGIIAAIALGHPISHFETTRLRKDGSSVEVSLTVSPVCDACGVVIGASKIMRDITERKRVGKEMLSSQAKLAAALGSMADAVFICDAQGNLVHFNHAFAVFHRFPDTAACLKALEQYPALFEASTADGQLLAMEQWPISRALRGETGTVEINLRRTDADEHWIASYNFAPILDSDGAITGVVLTARDITEQKENQARLETMRAGMLRVGRLNDLGQISAGLAHELNQPLSAMYNYSVVAKRLMANGDPASLQKAHDAISKATDQAVRAGEIIQRMRAFIERREASQAVESVNAIVEEAMAVGLMGAKVDGITAHLELAPNAPPVFVDRVQIQQVIVNLLRNAIEAMADSPRRELTISTAVDPDGAVEIAVQDTGPGIPGAIVDNLFMPFVTTKPSGMGIGLVISQSIVEAHGGRITVESNPGSGTRFQFKLPSTAVAVGRAAA